MYFSPRGGCTEAIIAEINTAKREIKVQAYRLSSAPIAKALLESHRRGVRVQIVLDGAQQSDKYSDATFFHNFGMNVLIDGSHAIAHDKVMIIDGEKVITGSFNFSAAAESANAENMLILAIPEIAKLYAENFSKHIEHAVAYRPPAAGPQTTVPE